jgi:hypothetical protein
VKGAFDADPLNSQGAQFSHTELNALQAHDNIDGPVHRLHQGGNVIFAGKTWRIQNIRACLLISLPIF